MTSGSVSGWRFNRRTCPDEDRTDRPGRLDAAGRRRNRPASAQRAAASAAPAGRSSDSAPSGPAADRSRRACAACPACSASANRPGRPRPARASGSPRTAGAARPAVGLSLEMEKALRIAPRGLCFSFDASPYRPSLAFRMSLTAAGLALPPVAFMT